MAFQDTVHETNFGASAAPGLHKEVVGLFTSSDDLQNAIRDLEGTAFPRQDISVMGARAELLEVFGAKAVDPHFAMDNADTPRQAPARPEEKTIGASAMVGIPAYLGAMAAALTAGAVAFPAFVGAAVIGGLGGGALGGILAGMFGNRDTRHIEEQIEKGGLLLWVRTPDREREDIAVDIMRKNNGSEIHVHEIE